MSRTTAVRPLLTAIALATAAAAIAVPARQALEARSRESVLTAANDAWLNRLTGKHRRLFDMPSPNGGIPLVHMLNFHDTYNKAYGVGDLDVNAIGTFYGATTFYGLNDAMWAKYRLGEFSETTDPATGKPAVVNPWRAAPVIMGMTLPQASIEALQLRGATFIICDNALGIFAGLVAKARGLDPAAVDADFKANILPGVTRVPGMVVAIQKAQEKGITYHRQ